MNLETPKLKIKATLFKQHSTELAMFILPSNVLRRISYVLPRTHDNPEEIQRLLSVKRLREIGTYIKRSGSLIPNCVVVNLLPNVQVQRGAIANEATIIFPSDGSQNQ